jgi:hypothetical protein
MAGLAPQQPAGPQPGAPTPEEQQAYDEFVARAYLVIFDEKAGALRAGIADMLRDGEDPVGALAETTAAIYGRVSMEARKAAKEIAPDVRQGAITEIFEKLAEIAELMNGNFMKTDKDLEAAYLQAVDAVRISETSAGGVDPAAEAERLKAMAAGA